MFWVSLTKDNEVIVIIIHVKTVVETENIAPSITALLVENLAKATKKSQFLTSLFKQSGGE